MKTNKHKEFKFHPTLNQAYLSTFYEGDLQYACEMFRVFLDDGMATADGIEQSLRQSDREALVRSVHKLKPALAMVGLTALAQQMEVLETMIKRESSFQKIGSQMKNFLNRVYCKVPVLRQEVERMEAALKEEIME